jgi:hypothetical protein
MMRNSGLVEGLIENGHQVDILSIHPNVNHIQNASILPQTRVFRIGSSASYDVLEAKANNSLIRMITSRLIRSIYRKISLYNYTYLAAIKARIDVLPIKEYDIVISSSDPKTSHLLARELKKQGLKAGKWIQYWGDPMSLDITNNVIWPKWFIRIVEKRILKEADSIIYVSPFTLEKQKELFKEHSNKMKCIPIPYINTKQYNINKNDSILKVSYLGSYYSKVRNIVPLYNAVLGLNQKVELVIAGTTDIKLENSENVKVLPNMNRIDLSKYEDESDAIICVLNSSGTQVPGKLYHYAGTNIPILVIVDGEYGSRIKEYLEKFDRYVLCENNERSISEALLGIKQKREQRPALYLSPINIAQMFLQTENILKGKN